MWAVWIWRVSLELNEYVHVEIDAFSGEERLAGMESRDGCIVHRKQPRALAAVGIVQTRDMPSAQHMIVYT